MIREQILLLDLTKVAIGNAEKVSVPDNIEWSQIIDLSLRQGINAIILDGLNNCFDNGLPINIGFHDKMKLIGAAQQVEAVYNQHKKVINQLTQFYQKYDIRMMVLKGWGLSLNYPVPNHRPCGDIDIYLFGDIEKADALLCQVYGIKVDKSHHNHTVFPFHGVTIENHYNFANIYAHRSSKKVDGWLKEMAKSCLKKDNVWLPSPDFNALYILRHAASHFAAEQISIRHLLDWALFVEKNYDKIDWDLHWSRCEELNMEKFLLSINEICVRYLGFSSDKFRIGGDLKLTERVLHEILQPEFEEEVPRSIIPYLCNRWRRWKSNTWKRQIVYSESTATTLATQLFSHIIKPASFRN
jgi:hypothetical protein